MMKRKSKTMATSQSSVPPVLKGLKTDRTPRDYFLDMISVWEGGFQKYPEDVGNWVTFPDGKRELIGTNMGVTPSALAFHRGVPPSRITEEDMKALTVEEAADIGMKSYYEAPGLDILPWTPGVEAVTDIGWGSGPVRGIKMLQQVCGTTTDGIIGPKTMEAYRVFIETHGHERFLRDLHDLRADFYRQIVQNRPSNKIFLKGWLNRAKHYLPDNKAWWPKWKETE